MLIKDNRLSCKEDYHIKPLDLIRVDFEAYIVVPANTYNQEINMINMESGEMYDHETFNHPIHLHNHLLKHFGEYELIKSHELEINLAGPVRTIKKGVKL